MRRSVFLLGIPVMVVLCIGALIVTGAAIPFLPRVNHSETSPPEETLINSPDQNITQDAGTTTPTRNDSHAEQPTQNETETVKLTANETVTYSAGNYSVNRPYSFNIHSVVVHGTGNNSINDWMNISPIGGKVTVMVNGKEISVVNGTAHLDTWSALAPGHVHDLKVTITFHAPGDYVLKFYELCHAGHPVSTKQIQVPIYVVLA